MKNDELHSVHENYNKKCSSQRSNEISDNLALLDPLAPESSGKHRAKLIIADTITDTLLMEKKKSLPEGQHEI